MYKISVKNSQADFVNTGMLFQGTWYVDNSIIDGLEAATFCSVAGGKSKCLSNGIEDQATLWHAGKDTAKASGVVYMTSAPDRYRRSDDMSDETRLFPYGKRQDLAMGLLKKCVIEVSNGTRETVFRTFDKTISASGITEDGFSTSEKVKYGDKVEVNGTIHWITEVVGANVKVTPAIENTAGSAVILKSQIDDPIYLNDKVEWKGECVNTSELPFTTIRAYNAGEIDQLVGYIESPIAVRIDLTQDINPQKI